MSDDELEENLTDNVINEEVLQPKKNIKEITDPKQFYKDSIAWFKQFKDNKTEKKLDNDKSPWIERFRPQSLDEIISHKYIIETFKQYINKKRVPHLLLYGPPGIGKTTAVLAFAHELYKENYPFMVLNINASEERGIEVVRNKIKDFIVAKGVYLKKKSCTFKLVVLDEADAITADAQAMLRNVIEKYTSNVRFCLICNYIKKINPSIQSRCTLFKFSPLSRASISIKVKTICDKLKIKILPDGIDILTKLSNGDLRKVINILQIVNMLGIKHVTEETVTKLMGYPRIKDIEEIFDIIVKNDIETTCSKINNIIYTYGFSVADIITEISDLIINKFINKKINLTNLQFNELIGNLKNIEMNLSVCPNEHIQLLGVISTLNILKKI